MEKQEAISEILRLTDFINQTKNFVHIVEAYSNIFLILQQFTLSENEKDDIRSWIDDVMIGEEAVLADDLFNFCHTLENYNYAPSEYQRMTQAKGRSPWKFPPGPRTTYIVKSFVMSEKAKMLIQAADEIQSETSNIELTPSNYKRFEQRQNVVHLLSDEKVAALFKELYSTQGEDKSISVCKLGSEICKLLQ